MKTIKQKEIKNLVTMGAAVDITTAAESRELSQNCDRVGVSLGVYGMNGGLLQDRRNGKLYAITARNSVLFYYF